MGEADGGAGRARLGDRPERLLWQRLLADLRGRLAAGEFGTGFPGELALVGEYRVSRHTVRQAVAVLRDEGLVVGTRGRQSRRGEPEEIVQRLGALYSLHDAVRALGLDPRSVVRTLDTRADGVVAARLGLEESTPLVHLERLRYADGEPLALDRVWLPHALAAPLLDVDFRSGALYRHYADLCGVVLTGGSEEIQPVPPTPAERELLGAGPETVAFSVRRLGRAHDRPVEWRHTLVRGDRFVLRADFADREGYHLDLLARPARTDPRR